MSKLKLVELNRQVASKSEEVIGRILNLQTDAQQQISVLKKIEAELIKRTREEAEAQKHKLQEMENKRKEEEAKKIQDQKDQAAKETAVAAQKTDKEDQAETPRIKEAPVKEAQSKPMEQTAEVKEASVERAANVQNGPTRPEAKEEKAVEIKPAEKSAASESAKEKEAEAKIPAAKQDDIKKETQRLSRDEGEPAALREGRNVNRDSTERQPASFENQGPAERRERQEGQRQGERRDYPPRDGQYQRPERRDTRQEGQRPQGQYPPRDGQYQRPQGQYPPRDGQYQRPQGQYPPRDGQYQRPQGQYPPRDGQYQRPQGQYPPRDGQYQRPQGQYPPRDGQYQRPQGQYPPRDGQYQRPQGQYPPRDGGGFNRGFDKDKDADRPQQRPAARSGPKSRLNLPSDFTPPAEKQKVSNYGSKKPAEKKPETDSKNKVSKKLLVQETRIMDDEDGMPRGSKKIRGRREKPAHVFEPIVIDKATITTEMVTIKTLADKTGKPASDIIKKLFLLGMMCTINSEISFETAQLICSDFGIELEYKPEKTYEEALIEEDKQDEAENLQTRPPVVTIMGHVDHGKTSLLDAIRSTKVTEQEAGGITQHIGAYSIKLNGKAITFLDTPGHEAFTAMRARGAQVTDIAVLVVAADDGIMPQTVEAINHAKAAKVPIIVAVNKMDKENANPERVKQELTEHELLAEEWGGDTIVVPVSAVTHEGIDKLLEMILLVADVQELKANPDRMAKGTIIEARLDKGRGPVATVLVQNGTLRISDTIVAGTAYGRVRAMTDDNGKSVKEALPSMPVEVVGFSEVPVAGDIIYAVEQDKLSKQVAEERKDKQKADMLKNISKVSLDDLFSRIAEGSIKDLNLIVKADVQGSVEAVTQALSKLSNEEVSVKIIHSGVGAIQKTDVVLASASNAIIIGFNVRPDVMARELAEKENIDIRLYRIIYNAIEDIEKALKGMLKPKYEEVILGHAQVRTIFKASSVGTIAGSYITDGKITRNAKVRLLRDNVVIHEGSISSLKRFKDDAKEVLTGFECGITLEGFNDIKEDDVIEGFEMREIKQ